MSKFVIWVVFSNSVCYFQPQGLFTHIYLMSRLSLKVFYLWRNVLSTAPPPFILWWSNLEILFAPLHRSSPFIGGLRCQAIQTEHGPYIAERTQKAVCIVRCLMFFSTSSIYYAEPGSHIREMQHCLDNLDVHSTRSGLHPISMG
jgi:hypothetical protein